MQIENTPRVGQQPLNPDQQDLTPVILKDIARHNRSIDTNGDHIVSQAEYFKWKAKHGGEALDASQETKAFSSAITDSHRAVTNGTTSGIGYTSTYSLAEDLAFGGADSPTVKSLTAIAGADGKITHEDAVAAAASTSDPLTAEIGRKLLSIDKAQNGALLGQGVDLPTLKNALVDRLVSRRQDPENNVNFDNLGAARMQKARDNIDTIDNLAFDAFKSDLISIPESGSSEPNWLTQSTVQKRAAQTDRPGIAGYAQGLLNNGLFSSCDAANKQAMIDSWTAKTPSAV